MLSAMPDNLPLEKTRFVGRQQLLAALEDLINRSDVRLITLTGPGGSGKTRLALRAARELIEEFQSGVFFVALGAVTDPDLVLPAAARALGLKESADRSLIQTFRDSLGDRQILLVLDNFEQILGAAASIADLLAACPGLKALVTSRAVLHLTGE